VRTPAAPPSASVCFTADDSGRAVQVLADSAYGTGAMLAALAAAGQTALQQVADHTSLDPLARFIDGLLVAIERGTPLAEVLHARQRTSARLASAGCSRPPAGRRSP
jgi:hypothetical protein